MGDGEVLPWLKALPLAPEYRPTEAEFADPIEYILKIEKEACQYGICKIIPPIPKAPKRVVIANLNRCLGQLQSNNNSSSAIVAVAAGASPNVHGSNAYKDANEFCKGTDVAKFTTRQQQIGWSPKKARGGPLQTVVQKSVWESGETYTLEEFEAKARMFARSRLKSSRDVAPLVAETMFWRATADKPITVEYANDIPGTAFGEPNEKFLPASSAPQQRKMQCQRKHKQKEGSQNSCLDLSNTAWNMRIASRSHGSLLRYMPDEVPGVTSPMVYIAMLFSWFAWHVEDHDLHSLNYLHMGASKTWYAVPGDAAPAFEEVIRRDGYGGQVNPIVALGMLAEKTTVMSPEVLMAAGVPCCRLVQNAGEFVVTFPRAYHLGFSHGFNCGEAANLATPEWLKMAKEAAVRRAAMDYLPMLSHQQLLYLLAMAFNSRIPEDVASQPRSRRLKYRQKGEGEMVLKESFVNDVIENNQLLSIFLQKSSTRHAILWNSANVSCDLPSSPFSTPETKYNATSCDVNGLKVPALQSDTLVNISTSPGRNEDMFMESSSKIAEEASSTAGIGVSLSNNDKNKNLVFYNNAWFPPSCTDNIHIQRQSFKRGTSYTNMDRDSGPLACIACGVLGFASMVVIQPCQEAARKLLPSYSKLDQKYFETFGTGSVSCDVACGGITASYSQSPIIDEKSGMDIENVQLDNHGAALASTANITAYTNLLDEEGRNHNLVDFPNLSIMKTNLATDLSKNKISNDIMASWQFTAKENNAVACSKNTFMTCKDNACEGHSKYLSSVICLENSPGTDNEKNTHAYGDVAENINSVEKFCEHSESKKWKESPNLSTLNNAGMPNSFSVCSASGMPQVSALDLLAVTYGDSVDSDEDDDASQVAKKDSLCGLPNSARTCENGHKLSGIADATGTDVCVQCLPGHLSSTLVAKIKTEETHDDPISAGNKSEYRCSFLCTGPRDSSNISMGKDKDNMGEMSNNTPNQSPKRNITCHTSVAESQKSSHDELNVGETQTSVILKRNQQQKGILIPPVCEVSSNTLSNIDKNLKETSGSNALPSNQCGYIDMKVSEDSKDLTGSINSPTGEIECKLVSTEASANKFILEGKVVSTSFTTPTDKSDIDAHRFSEAFPASDQHSGILVRLDDELKESNVRDRGNYLSVRKNKAQTCHLAGNTMGSFTKTGSLKGNIDDTPIESANAASLWKPSKGFLRPQVFCLQHAIEIEQQLQPIGGAHLLLLCHSNYPLIEKQARSMASEIGNNYLWKDIPLRDAAAEDLEVIHSAIDDEGGYELASTDWTVCLDMSLHHSINLSKSPLYSKQIPYNPILDALFFSSSSDNCSPNSAYGSEWQYDSTKQRKKSKHKKITVAGKWCGRVWMVNQVHPYLASDKFQSSASFGTLKTRKLRHGVSQEQGHPWKHMIEEADCKPIVKPERTMIPDVQISMPLLRGPDAMIPDEQISMPLLGGPDIEQVSSANLRAIAEESSACQEGGKPQQYTTVQNTDYKPELEKRTTFTRNEHSLITYTKNTQKVSISRKSIMKRKFHSGQTYDINKKVKLLESTTPDSDGRTLLPNYPIDVQGDSMMVSDKGFSAYSKGELAAKPTASCVVGEEPKHKVVDEDYAQAKADHTQEKMVEVDTEVQHTHGTNAQNKGCISQWTRNRRLPDSCDTLKKKETKCSVRSKRNMQLGLKDGNKVHSAEGSQVSTLENTVVSKSQIVSHNPSPTGELEGGPSTRLRSRSLRDKVEVVSKVAEKALLPQPASTKKISRGKKKTKAAPSKNADKKNGYHCDTEGCTMNFTTKQDLHLHKRNTCPIKGCGKHFISHKYLLHHRRVHLDDRPLTCPWKGCGKTFKWAWARTEHVRVHTKERPYVCKTAGCGKTFRFVSDFSRHKRKTGHPKQ